MAVGNIFNIPIKDTINYSLQSKSIMVVGKSKAGKSTISAQAPRPIFLMTENGGEMLTGFTPIPIATWSDFKNVVAQLCSSNGRENFDTVVIDTYTNLITILDKYIGSKLSTEKASYDFGSDIDYGKGTKAMKVELGFQLQRLANQGYLLMNIVHAEEKVDFDTSTKYIGTSLSNSLYGVAEKFVDQIIYLRREERPNKNGVFEYRTYFNAKGGFSGAGGRLTTEEDYVPTTYLNIEAALLKAIRKIDETEKTLVKNDRPSVIIEQTAFNFDDLILEFKELTDNILKTNPELAAGKIKSIVESILGSGKKVSNLSTTQVELLADIINNLKTEFNL